MNWTLWWLFVPTETALCLTPGPAVLLVLATALRRGATRSIFSNLGILSANTTYFALSATSVGALLLTSYRIFFLVKWIGAGYLVYLGLKALLAKSPVLAGPPDQLGRDRSAARLFLDGFLLQISNPKALVFFAALLPQFIDARGSVACKWRSCG
jgi:homoserine/homoserine lactone efflux protein